jgi:imidazolonepropionase-like amidohydrolase
MQEADANIRDAVNRGLMIGPRLYVATRALASTGSYEPRTENHIGGTCMPAGSDACDGPDGVRKAVRRRVAYGADIIKFYADFRRKIMRFPPTQQHPYISADRFPTPNPNPDIGIYSQGEMDTICEEARLADLPAVAHAKTKAAILGAVRAGVLSIEHGYWADDECLLAMRETGCIFVPTLSIVEQIHKERFHEVLATVKRAYELGVKLACGGDTGTIPHGENAREIELFVMAGIPIEDVLVFATIGGWESCGGLQTDRRFGWLEPGTQADIIALSSDPRVDVSAMRKVEFVMKDAMVYKRDGIAAVV